MLTGICAYPAGGGFSAIQSRYSVVPGGMRMFFSAGQVPTMPSRTGAYANCAVSITFATMPTDAQLNTLIDAMTNPDDRLDYYHESDHDFPLGSSDHIDWINKTLHLQTLMAAKGKGNQQTVTFTGGIVENSNTYAKNSWESSAAQSYDGQLHTLRGSGIQIVAIDYDGTYWNDHLTATGGGPDVDGNPGGYIDFDTTDTPYLKTFMTWAGLTRFNIHENNVRRVLSDGTTVRDRDGAVQTPWLLRSRSDAEAAGCEQFYWFEANDATGRLYLNATLPSLAPYLDINNQSGNGSYVGSDSYTSGNNTSTTGSVTIPTVAVGDTLLLGVGLGTSGGATLTAPSGWTSLGSYTNGAEFAQIFAKKAVSADIGSTLTLNISVAARWAFCVIGDTGHATLPSGAQVAFNWPANNATTHVTPNVTAPGAADVGTFIFERVGTGPSTSYTNSAGPVRETAVGAGTNGYSVAYADSNGPVAAGTVNGGTWTGTVTSPNAIVATIAYPAAGGTVPTYSGTAALTGSGTLGALAKPTGKATPALTGSGTLTAATQAPGQASLSGAGTLSAATSGPRGTTTAALTGSGVLAAVVAGTGVINVSPANVTWAPSAQASYQVQMLDAVTGAVLFDTGEVASATARSQLVPVTSGTVVIFQVRVSTHYGSGFWSAWATSVAETVSIPLPSLPVLTLAADPTVGSITAFWTNPAGGDHVNYMTLYRTDTTAGTPEMLVATNQPTNSSWTDWTPASTHAYAYRVVAAGVSGAYRSSATATIALMLTQSLMYALPSAQGSNVPFTPQVLAMFTGGQIGGGGTRTVTGTAGGGVRIYAGNRARLVMTADDVTTTYVAFMGVTEAQKQLLVRRFDAATPGFRGAIVLFRDTYGRRLFCTYTAFEDLALPGIFPQSYSIGIQLQSVTYIEDPTATGNAYAGGGGGAATISGSPGGGSQAGVTGSFTVTDRGDGTATITGPTGT